MALNHSYSGPHSTLVELPQLPQLAKARGGWRPILISIVRTHYSLSARLY